MFDFIASFVNPRNCEYFHKIGALCAPWHTVVFLDLTMVRKLLISFLACVQMGLSLSWFVPRLLPTFAPLLPCMYGHDDLAFPLLSILTERPPTLKVRLEGGVGDAHGFSPFPGQTTPTPAPPESNGKFRKRKPSRGTDPLQGVPLPSTPQVPSTKEFVLPVVHHGSPATWYGIPLATAFTRMLKVASSSSGLLLGPWSVLHAGKGEDIPPPPCDVEVLPAEGVNAGVLACVPLFAAEHKKCARVLPPLLLSHFAAGIASALLAPSFMYNFTV